MASLATANADAAASASSSDAVDVKKWNGPTPKLNDYRDDDIMYLPQMLTEASEIEAFEEMKKNFEGHAVASCEDTLLRCLMARDFNVVSEILLHPFVYLISMLILILMLMLIPTHTCLACSFFVTCTITQCKG